MQPHWIIEQSDLERENWDKIAQLVSDQGAQCVRTKYVPFSTERLKTPFNDRECVVVFGCLGLVRTVNLKHAWTPGVWCDWDLLRCSSYLSYWGRFSIQQNYAFYPLAEIKRKKEYLFEIFRSREGKLKDHIFVRPNDNFKSFNGELVAPEYWDRFMSNVFCYEPAIDTMSMVSQPTEITDEWRFVIADRKVVTGSQYRKNGEVDIAPGFSDDAAAFAESITHFSEWQPHPIHVLDICKTVDGEYRMMEIGSINGAGLYDCEIPKLIKAVTEVAVREWTEINE